MRHLVQSTFSSQSDLRNKAKAIFAECRRDPVNAHLLQRGTTLTCKRDGFDIKISMCKDETCQHVHIEEVDFKTLHLILPRYNHWASHHGVVEAPMWLSVALENIDLKNRRDLDPVWSMFSSQVSVGQLAQCLSDSEAAIATRIFYADALGSSGSYAQQLLAASLLSSEGSLSEWVVDLRGYMLSLIASAESP
jgi:hypothetical protein